MSKHTELPWKSPDYKNTLKLVNKDGVMICDALIANGGGGHKSFHEAEANATFIIKACNNHYQLLDALRVLVYEVEFTNGEDIAEPLERANQAIKDAS